MNLFYKAHKMNKINLITDNNHLVTFYLRSQIVNLWPLSQKLWRFFVIMATKKIYQIKIN